MEIYERILTKSEINNRFVTAVDAVLANDLISSKSGLAESLRVKPAKFSEILNYRMNAGVDMLAIMCDRYKVSPDWLLMSRGGNIFRTTALPNVCVDEMTWDNEFHRESPKDVTSISTSNSKGEIAPFIELIHEKDVTIREQAEEIGRLKARIEELERSRGASASGVPEQIAHAG